MNKVVIADKYQCPRVDGKYQLEQKILKRKGLKTTQDYVDRINAQDNGLMFVVDVKATKENQLARTGVTQSEVTSANKNSKVITPDDTKPKLKDLRELHPHIKSTSVEDFLSQLEAEKGQRKTDRPQED